jgi:hypothetical protein
MYPPIYATCSDDSGVQAALGTNPCRLYPFGQSVQGGSKPYAVWQIIGGSPENYLDTIPDIDSMGVQVDVYATSVTDARAAAVALRDAIEPVAYITRWGGEMYEVETKLYRVTFDVDWFVHR